MKEEYFSPEIINIKALEMLGKVKNILGKIKKQEFIPQNSALIVIDMQDYFCSESSHAFVPSSLAIIPKIKSLITSYKTSNLPVIFTKHINTVENANMMQKWWKNLNSPGNYMSEIISEYNTENSFLIEKSQYDAFYNTKLETFLKKNNISQLIITGVLTHLCCETTARSAFVRGFETFLCIDSTATYNESFHTSSMLNLAHGFSNLILSAEILETLQEATKDDSM